TLKRLAAYERHRTPQRLGTSHPRSIVPHRGACQLAVTGMSPSEMSETNRRRLHNWTRSEHKGQPQYENGWDGRLWTSAVKVDGNLCGEGVGNNKTMAQENAATEALRHFQINP
ncbi:hypothetical protein AX14_012995, partial [Amanita brunnescens Koide BX004]